MQENLFWTEKISLGTIRDPLQLSQFVEDEQKIDVIRTKFSELSDSI